MKRESRCFSCHWFETWNSDDDTSIGSCRAHAPRPVTFDDKKSSHDIETHNATWPVVRADDWCGEWKDRR